MEGDPHRDLTPRWQWLVLLAITLLLPSTQASLAQETRGETEISIVVHPGESPSGNHVPPSSNGASAGSGYSGVTQGEPGARRIGTLSSLIVYFPATADDTSGSRVMAFVVICDDRRTVTGWDANLSFGEAGPGRTANLIENRTSTIRRILPAEGGMTDQVGQVRGGLSLGPLAPPVSLLHAAPGAGSGVYLQQLLIAPGRSQDPDLSIPILIQLSESP